jgi:predicted acyl esterase
VLTKGWLRASHRALDSDRSLPYRPWHPHSREAAAAVVPGRPTEYLLEVLPTSNLFRVGHRIRLEIASCDPVYLTGRWSNRGLLAPSDNTVLEGRGQASRLLLPVVPR